MTTTVNPAPKPDRADDATERLRAAVLAKRTPTLSISDERSFRDLQAQGRNDEAARLLKDRSRDFRAENQAIVRMNQGELMTYDAALERGDRQGQLRAVGAMVQRVSRLPARQTNQALER
jgi:hypothetical protein